MSSIKFNVNHEIRVLLFPSGQRIYAQCRGCEPQIEMDGRTVMPMTAFIEMFGSHVTPTMNPPFDPRIELISENTQTMASEGLPSVDGSPSSTDQ